MKDIIMPELEDSNDFAVIAYWHFEEGDPVEEGDDLVAVNTSGGTIHLPAPVSGVLHEVYCDEGEDVEAGEGLGCIEEDEIEEEISDDELPEVEYEDNAEEYISEDDIEEEETDEDDEDDDGDEDD